jgi:hypothetical protein
VTHDALDGGWVRARHHEQRSGRVPEMVEANRTHEAVRPELHVALGAATQDRVGRLIAMTAAVATAGVAVGGDDPGASEGAAQDDLERERLARDGPVGLWED